MLIISTYLYIMFPRLLIPEAIKEVQLLGGQVNGTKHPMPNVGGSMYRKHPYVLLPIMHP
jgi:hypothetical protein